MKNIIFVVLLVVLQSSLFANTNVVTEVKENIKEGYKVGYVVDSYNVMDQSFHSWHLSEDGELVQGWFIAYDLEAGDYYYISEEAAQSSIE